MPADYSKLLSHPDKDEIISKLVSGVPPKTVSEWLRLKYNSKEHSHLRLSVQNLREFVNNNLDLYNQVQKDVLAVANGQKAPPKPIAESLRNNKTYKERLNEIADNELNINKTLSDVIYIIKVRAEQVFDKIQENPSNIKPDYALIKWFEILFNAIEKYDKIVNKSPDQVIQHNISIQMVDNYAAIFQDTIREVVSMVDPDTGLLIMEKISDRLSQLKEPVQETLSQDKRLAQAQIISNTVATLNEIGLEDDEFSS